MTQPPHAHRLVSDALQVIIVAIVSTMRQNNMFYFIRIHLNHVSFFAAPHWGGLSSCVGLLGSSPSAPGPWQSWPLHMQGIQNMKSWYIKLCLDWLGSFNSSKVCWNIRGCWLPRKKAPLGLRHLFSGNPTYRDISTYFVNVIFSFNEIFWSTFIIIIVVNTWPMTQGPPGIQSDRSDPSEATTTSPPAWNWHNMQNWHLLLWIVWLGQFSQDQASLVRS